MARVLVLGAGFGGIATAAVLSAPSAAQRFEKERFESERLAAWFGG